MHVWHLTLSSSVKILGHPNLDRVSGGGRFSRNHLPFRAVRGERPAPQSGHRRGLLPPVRFRPSSDLPADEETIAG